MPLNKETKQNCKERIFKKFKTHSSSDKSLTGKKDQKSNFLIHTERPHICSRAKHSTTNCFKKQRRHILLMVATTGDDTKIIICKAIL